MSHEITAAFRDRGLPLARTLEDMLDEHSSHRTERRGCGYTQATRHLAASVNRREAIDTTNDLSLFARWPERESATLAAMLVERGWLRGWRSLERAPATTLAQMPPSPLLDALIALDMRLREVRAMLALPESFLILDLIAQILSRDIDNAPCVPGMPEKPQIGSCSQAEEFFLEIAHGKVRRGGRVNVIVGADGQPLMLEKMNLGESHSAIVVAPICINHVRIPIGSLCALRYPENASGGTATPHGARLPLEAIAQARFLRLTTLSVPPPIRRRAFSAQVDAQVRGNMLSPLTTTPAELLDFAHRELRT